MSANSGVWGTRVRGESWEAYPVIVGFGLPFPMPERRLFRRTMRH